MLEWAIGRFILILPAFKTLPAAVERYRTTQPAGETQLPAFRLYSPIQQEGITLPKAILCFMETLREAKMWQTVPEPCSRTRTAAKTRLMATTRSGTIPPLGTTLPMVSKHFSIILPAPTTPPWGIRP